MAHRVKARVGMLCVLGIAAATSVGGQPFDRGMTLSTEFLTSLAEENLSQSQVAIINVSVSSVVIIDRNASGAPVTFVSGGSTSLWAQIAHQLLDSVSNNEPMHLKVERWTIAAAACPTAAARVRQFLARLQEVAAKPGGTSLDSTREIVVDGPSFRIVTQGRDVWVTITPNAALNPPLQQEAERLHSVVSGCTTSITPSIEQDDF